MKHPKHNKIDRITVAFDDPGKVEFESDDPIPDATEVYGDWPEVDTPCDLSPVGQCEFSAREPETCIHCGRKT